MFHTRMDPDEDLDEFDRLILDDEEESGNSAYLSKAIASWQDAKKAQSTGVLNVRMLKQHTVNHSNYDDSNQEDDISATTVTPPISLVRSLSKKFDKKEEDLSPGKKTSPTKKVSPFKWPPSNGASGFGSESNVKPMSMMELARQQVDESRARAEAKVAHIEEQTTIKASSTSDMFQVDIEYGSSSKEYKREDNSRDSVSTYDNLDLREIHSPKIDKEEARKRGQDILSRLIGSPSMPRESQLHTFSSSQERQGQDESNMERGSRTKSMDSAFIGQSLSSLSNRSMGEEGGMGEEESIPSTMLRRGSISDAMDAIRMVQQAMHSKDNSTNSESVSSTSTVANDKAPVDDDLKWEKMDRELFEAFDRAKRAQQLEAESFMVLNGAQPPKAREDIELAQTNYEREEANEMSNTLALYVDLDNKMLSDDNVLSGSHGRYGEDENAHQSTRSSHTQRDITLYEEERNKAPSSGLINQKNTLIRRGARLSVMSTSQSSFITETPDKQNTRQLLKSRMNTTGDVISPTQRDLFGGQDMFADDATTPTKQVNSYSPHSKAMSRSMSLGNVEGLSSKLDSPFMPLPDYPRKKTDEVDEIMFIPYKKPPLSEEKVKYGTLKEKEAEKEKQLKEQAEAKAKAEEAARASLTSSRTSSVAPMSRSAQRRQLLDKAKEEERSKVQNVFNIPAGDDRLMNLRQREQDLDGFSVCSADQEYGSPAKPFSSQLTTSPSFRSSSLTKRLLNRQKSLSSSSTPEFVSPIKNNDASAKLRVQLVDLRSRVDTAKRLIEKGRERREQQFGSISRRSSSLKKKHSQSSFDKSIEDKMFDDAVKDAYKDLGVVQQTMTRLAGSPEVLHSTVLALARAVAKVEHMAESQARHYPVDSTLPNAKESQLKNRSSLRSSQDNEKRAIEDVLNRGSSQDSFSPTFPQPHSTSAPTANPTSFETQHKIASTTRALLDIRRGSWMVGALQQLNHNVSTSSPSPTKTRPRGQDLIPTEASQLSLLSQQLMEAEHALNSQYWPTQGRALCRESRGAIEKARICISNRDLERAQLIASTAFEKTELLCSLHGSSASKKPPLLSSPPTNKMRRNHSSRCLEYGLGDVGETLKADADAKSKRYSAWAASTARMHRK